MTNVEKGSGELSAQIGKDIVEKIGKPRRSGKRSTYAQETVELGVEALAAAYTELGVPIEDAEAVAKTAAETFREQDPARIFDAARSVVQTVTQQDGSVEDIEIAAMGALHAARIGVRLPVPVNLSRAYEALGPDTRSFVDTHPQQFTTPLQGRLLR